MEVGRCRLCLNDDRMGYDGCLCVYVLREFVGVVLGILFWLKLGW